MLSIVVAMVLIMIFVVWAGLHGVAATSYLKDTLMVIALAIVAFGVLLAYQPAGGLHSAVTAGAEQLLTIHPAAPTDTSGTPRASWSARSASAV